MFLSDDYFRQLFWRYLDAKNKYFATNTLRKSNIILRLHFGNLRKLLSANVDGTKDVDGT